MWGDASDGEGSDADGEEEVEVWAMDDEGRWVEDDAEDGEEWSTDDEDAMDVDGDDWASTSPTVLQVQDMDALIVTNSAPEPTDNPAPEIQLPAAAGPLTPDVPIDAAEVEDAEKGEADDGQSLWKRFEVLPSAPVDHAFYATPPTQTSRSFLARLSKEYRALQSSLPGMLSYL